MSITSEQYASLIARMNKSEETINDILIAIKKFVTTTQVQQLLTLVQTELADVKSTVDSLEQRVESIEEEPLT
jgi:hypothetical protein